MREATSKAENPGFTLRKQRSKIHPPIKVRDLDFADDIALTLDTLEEAQNLLTKVENAARNVGLHLNAKKTEYNQPLSEIKSVNGEKIENVEDFIFMSG